MPSRSIRTKSVLRANFLAAAALCSMSSGVLTAFSPTPTIGSAGYDEVTMIDDWARVFESI
jgi:hypothetical protein